jgi:hypothetical protein
MVSIIDVISFEFFSVLSNPGLIITAFVGLLIWILFVGTIIAYVLKKYSFLGYPLNSWPGCGILAAFIFGIIMFIEVLIGFQSLSKGISLAIAIFFLSLIFGFWIQLKRVLMKRK